MCGIVGFTGRLAEKARVLKEMTDRIAHRGPDGEGHFVADCVALGHRRLSILDLEGGAQPMTTCNQRLTVVYNGEIYNCAQLRAELIALGHTFQSDHSDTEVLLHGYTAWGDEGLLQRLRGMFSFAIWDAQEESLFCARDHFGIKPFYYYVANDEKVQETAGNDEPVLLFGSEIKSFLPHPAFEKELNETQLELYLTFQYSPGEDTFFKGVKKLLPAHFLRWKHGKMETKRYWMPLFSPVSEAENARIDWAKKIEADMQESVLAHKISDVEVGSFLSSGVDSSYIASLAKVDKTFTVGFADKDYDETDIAAGFSKQIGVKNYPYRIEPAEYWAHIAKIQYHMDEPLADAASIALFFLNREASKQVKVCLSGEGADEFFGGYNIYKEPFTMTWYDKIPRPVRGAVGSIAQAMPPVRGLNFLVRRAKNLEERYIGNTNIFSEKQKKHLLKTYRGLVVPTDLSKPYFEKSKGLDPVARMQYNDLHLWMVGDILLKADKMSMAHGLELRVPFLDREVFETARILPAECRANATQTKRAMRSAAERTLPVATAEKKKLGFPVPVRAWLREEQYASVVRKAFQGEAAQKFFDVAVLEDLLAQHLSKKQDNWRQIWTIYIFLVWYDVYFSAENCAQAV